MKTLLFRLLLLAAWLGNSPLSDAAAPLATAGLPSPAGPGSGEPNLTRGPDGTLYLTWSGPSIRPGERALHFATLTPGATAWSPPRPIVSTPLLMENWADFASLAVGADSTLTAQWFQRPPGEEAHGYNGWFARSVDGGSTWTTPAPLGHEFVSLAPLSRGRLLAVWLESTRLHHAGEKHDHPSSTAPKDPAAPYQPSMCLRARLLGPDGTTIQNWIVDPDTCTCCQTSLAILPGDRAIVTYRGHTAGEVRDNRFAVFTGVGWTPPRTVHDDGWKIPACPVNGPAVDTLGEHTAIAWFTVADGIARVQARQSLDGGLTFGAVLALDLGHPMGRLDLVTLDDASSVVSWLEAHTDQNAAGLYVRRIFPDGTLSTPQLLAATTAARASGFPRMAARPGAGLPVVIAWTDTSGAAPRVLTTTFDATTLRPAAPTARAFPTTPRNTVIAANRPADSEFLEVCGPAN